MPTLPFPSTNKLLLEPVITLRVPPPVSRHRKRRRSGVQWGERMRPRAKIKTAHFYKQEWKKN
jgi:hypothetical protein